MQGLVKNYLNWISLKEFSLNLCKSQHLFFAGLLIFCLGMNSCKVQVPKNPKTLLWHLGAEPDTLNPITSTDVYASRIDSFVYETLLERNNKTLAFEPKLAKSWTASEDHLEFTFTLRQDVRWHDGAPFSADDIVYSFQRIMDPKVDAPHLRVYYQDIEKVEKITPHQVRFLFKKPYFMALEFCGGMPIVPKHIYKNELNFNRHPINRAPVGTGPYRFIRWNTGKDIVLSRNKKYWGDTPNIETIQFNIIAEDSVALQVLKKGGLDLAGLRPIQWVRQTSSKKFNKNFQKYKYYTPGYSFIGWNLRRPFFKDKRVRVALTHLIDRQAILKELNFNLGKVTTGPFYIEGKSYNTAIAPFPYDPQKAKTLLKEAGWKDTDQDGILDRDGKPFRFEFLIPSGRRFAEGLATILKEDLSKIGIIVEIRKLEWALFIQKLNDHTFDAVTLGWSFGFEQDPYQVWHSSQTEQGSNFVGFENKQVDTLIENARVEFDSEKRSEMHQSIHRIIHEEQPYSFLYASPSLVALDRRFKNVKVYPIGIDPLEWEVMTP
jgi:peptide/nickel transport system substrate-binding protein